MAASWRERLRSLRDRFFGKFRHEAIAGTQSPLQQDNSSRPTPTHSAVSPSPTVDITAGQHSSETVALNLGIDFGTSFTKVCFRDVGTEESFIVPFEGSTLAGALIPTIIGIDSTGRLYLGNQIPRDTPVTRVPYLKMRLAGLRLGEDLATADGTDLNSANSIRALSSWFLASILKLSQNWIVQNEENRLRNRTTVWSANVGVPVEHFDSDVINVFEQVLGVSWIWLQSGNIPKTMHEALKSYERTLTDLASSTTDFHAIPEIAAAVHSFVTSRESVPGIYIYFDIGGGTVDGVAFNLVNLSGERRINFYSGKVEPLGISAFTQEAGLAMVDVAASDTIKLIIKNSAPSSIENFAQRIRGLVGNVVMTAKKKDGRSWQRDAFQGGGFERSFIGALPTSQMVPLVIFLGGGGAKSEWYQQTISSTYQAFSHGKAGIPPYKLVEVLKPADLSMRGLPEADFGRFAISYGLSIPFGEGPDVGLPSQFCIAAEPNIQKIPGVVDYIDSKDVYE